MLGTEKASAGGPLPDCFRWLLACCAPQSAHLHSAAAVQDDVLFPNLTVFETLGEGGQFHTVAGACTAVAMRMHLHLTTPQQLQ